MEELGKLLADYPAEPSAEFASLATGLLVLFLLAAILDQSHQYTPSDLVLPETRLTIARFSPSFSLLRRLLDSGRRLEALSWREFEELVADLLLKDGYKVDLGTGRGYNITPSKWQFTTTPSH